MSWLTKTIEAKSDQLNACDLVQPITVAVTSVKQGTADQPVIVGIDGGRQPYKPCKSMRRVLVKLWGDNPEAWIGRRMTLYCDESVKWAGEPVGGIRISHLSNIDAPKSISLNVTKGKKGVWKVEPLADEKKPDVAERVKKFIELVNSATTLEKVAELESKVGAIYDACTGDQRAAIDGTLEEKKRGLKGDSN